RSSDLRRNRGLQFERVLNPRRLRQIAPPKLVLDNPHKDGFPAVEFPFDDFKRQAVTVANLIAVMPVYENVFAPPHNKRFSASISQDIRFKLRVLIIIKAAYAVFEFGINYNVSVMHYTIHRLPAPLN